MALAQRLDVEEGEYTLRLEQFERRDVTWNHPVIVGGSMKRVDAGEPLMILQKTHAAMFVGFPK